MSDETYLPLDLQPGHQLLQSRPSGKAKEKDDFPP